MINPLYSVFFFFFYSKEHFIFGWDFMLTYPLIFLISLFPLIFFLLKFCMFNSYSLKEFFLYKILLLFFFLFISFSFFSGNPVHFLFFLEICVILNILFLFNYSKDLDKISAVFFMILFNMSGSIPFFWFCSNFMNLSLMGCFHSYFLMFCFGLLLCSKVPIFIFHFWLTKAHVSSSGAGSMLLASLMLKIGSVGLAKWSNLFSFLFVSKSSYVFNFSLMSSIFFLLVMIRFFDLKYLVACYSVVHMNILFPLFMWSSSISFFSSSVMMVTHSLVSCLIFFLVTVLYEVSYERSLMVSKSLESYSPLLSLTFFIWFLFNLGFPPFLSFLGELYFLYFFFNFSFYSMLLFFLILLLTGLIFFVSISTFLFSKKVQFKTESLSIFFILINLIFFLFFSLMCFFS